MSYAGVAVYRSKTLQIYRLLIQASKLMPTKTGQKYFKTKVSGEFKRNKGITDGAKIEAELHRSYAILLAMAENDYKNSLQNKNNHTTTEL
eukprot:TRINITY_DN17590_c0_g1_i1.p1 TRINITY_DN17590_c0_g1~~TRINITY_DN17590_c0_g1_i1.p1  ORF type:complete len:105 (+),score=20.01 TRINITY_DN17590_c0_g1_i1:44-316(+)